MCGEDLLLMSKLIETVKTDSVLNEIGTNQTRPALNRKGHTTISAYEEKISLCLSAEHVRLSVEG